MLTKKLIAEAAQKHQAAELARTPMQAMSQFYPDMSIEDGYAIQDAWVRLKLDQGRKIIGRKVGLTSRAMQQAMKIDEPDFGTILDDMYFDNGATLAAADFIDPRLEVEFTFVLKSTLYGEKLTIDEVMAATDYIVPSLELIAARSYRTDPETGYTRKVMDTIADNAANAGIIVGDHKLRPEGVDLRLNGAIFYRNGIVEETGLGAGVMDHPARGLIWLAKRFAPHGIKLEAGQYIMSGSFTRPVLVRSGDHFMADFGQYGTVELSFS